MNHFFLGLFFIEFFFKGFVGGRKFLNPPARLGLGLEEQLLLGAQGPPGLELGDDVSRLGKFHGGRRRGGRRGGRGARSGSRMRIRDVRFRRFVLIDQLLNGGLLVAAGSNQVFLGVFEIVLVESQLGLRDAELLLKRILLTGAGFGQLLSELRHARLIGCNTRLRRLQARRSARVSGVGGAGFSAASRMAAAKAEIHGMVSEPESLLRKGLLARPGDSQMEPVGLSGFQRVRINYAATILGLAPSRLCSSLAYNRSTRGCKRRRRGQ